MLAAVSAEDRERGQVRMSARTQTCVSYVCGRSRALCRDWERERKGDRQTHTRTHTSGRMSPKAACGGNRVVFFSPDSIHQWGGGRGGAGEGVMRVRV